MQNAEVLLLETLKTFVTSFPSTRPPANKQIDIFAIISWTHEKLLTFFAVTCGFFFALEVGTKGTTSELNLLTIEEWSIDGSTWGNCWNTSSQQLKLYNVYELTSKRKSNSERGWSFILPCKVVRIKYLIDEPLLNRHLRWSVFATYFWEPGMLLLGLSIGSMFPKAFFRIREDKALSSIVMQECFFNWWV